MICVTLNAIRARRPCEPSWRKLLGALGKTKADDEPLALVRILDILGLDDALWCLRALPDEHHPLERHFAVDCLERVKHLMAAERSIAVLRIAREHAQGLATDDDLATAMAAARVAAWAAGVAARAAEAAEAAVADGDAWAAGVAARAAEAAVAAGVDWAAWAAVAAAGAAARVAARAAWAAGAAEAAEAAVWAAEKKWQTDRFRELFTAGTWSPPK